MNCIEVLSSYNPISGFQEGTIRHTAVTKVEKKVMNWVTVLPTHFDPYDDSRKLGFADLPTYPLISKNQKLAYPPPP